jgi:hypothetical protein
MNGNTSLVGMARVSALGLALWGSGQSLSSAEVTINRTNWVERWITNVIDIQMPENRFVNVYRTNWVTQLRTNVVDVYATNWTMCKVTNQIEVAATWTNHVTAYHTNWNTRTLTNRVAVNLVRTNFVDRYHTNWSMLKLTNWETVVLFKTNWITQPVTNVFQINLPKRPVAAAPAPSKDAEPKEAPAVATSPAPVGWAGPLAIEAVRTARPAANDMAEVQLRVRRSDNTATPLQVQHWRVEREDGTVLLFGQEKEFKRELLAGKYKVEAKLKGERDNPPLSVRGTLSVTTREAVIQPRLLVKK